LLQGRNASSVAERPHRLPLHRQRPSFAVSQWLDVDRRDNPHCVTKFSNFTPPIMSPTTSLHGDHAGRLFGEELKYFVTPQLSAKNDRASTVRAMNLEDILR